MNEVLEGHSIPWANCVALAVDNASVNLGARNSIKSRVLDQNPSIYVLGCPCHIVHNNAHAGGLVYSEMSGFEVEDFCVNLAYWFKSSTKRKNMLHGKWLSLDLAVNRIVRVYKALTSYFRSTDEKKARCLRLRALLEDPLTEVHLLFYQALLPTFCQFNLLFQRQHPYIYLLHGQVRAFIRKLMSKFLKPAAFRTTNLESVDLQDQENQLPDTQLGIGLTTKSTLIRLHEAGDIPSGDVTKFNKVARGFLLRSTEYALQKLPLNDPLLPHAEFVDFRQRQNSHLDDVLYFVQRYKHLLPFEDPREQDRISDEFLEYQMLEETDIPDMVWKGALNRSLTTMMMKKRLSSLTLQTCLTPPQRKGLFYLRTKDVHLTH
ncbi:Presenilins-associated rhomboid-like protein mitochondrial [Dissostichus eleginoides]|uniref:Presenilins-associated rhomboid-like protein mitochondrial n=1 Tax=Dissostichus eleginoides TaxID=100907 RepID=A0AAD9C7L6_DISEL|nr:Presenilins-associated rhomboid-like protein mitochondrial [Dissostichus eleginoides]